MSEKKKKKGKKRSKKQMIADMRRKADEMEAADAAGSIKTAVKDGRVAEENLKEYRKLLSQLKGIERAPGVLSAFGKDDEAKVAEKISKKLVGKLENLMEEPDDSEGDDDEDEGDEEEGDEEEEDDEEEGDEEDEEEEDDED